MIRLQQQNKQHDTLSTNSSKYTYCCTDTARRVRPAHHDAVIAVEIPGDDQQWEVHYYTIHGTKRRVQPILKLRYRC